MQVCGRPARTATEGGREKRQCCAPTELALSDLSPFPEQTEYEEPALTKPSAYGTLSMSSPSSCHRPHRR